MDLEAWCLWYKRRGAGRLRHLLMRRWDPIGVAGAPQARDEYDSYVGLVADRLRTGASVEVIAALLESIRCDQMGLPVDRAADIQVSETLRTWYAAEMARWPAAVVD